MSQVFDSKAGSITEERGRQQVLTQQSRTGQAISYPVPACTHMVLQLCWVDGVECLRKSAEGPYSDWIRAMVCTCVCVIMHHACVIIHYIARPVPESTAHVCMFWIKG